MSVTVKLDTKDFENRLKGYSEKVKREIKKEVALTAMEVIGDAKSRAPVDTGRLRASINELSRRSDGLGIEVGSNVKYAEKQENRVGFLKGAVESNRDPFERRIEKIVDARP